MHPGTIHSIQLVASFLVRLFNNEVGKTYTRRGCLERMPETGSAGKTKRWFALPENALSPFRNSRTLSTAEPKRSTQQQNNGGKQNMSQ